MIGGSGLTSVVRVACSMMVEVRTEVVKEVTVGVTVTILVVCGEKSGSVSLKALC